MSDFGFKTINLENWLSVDPVIACYGTKVNGETVPVPPSYWLENLLKPQLNLSVPEEVRKLFEIARGAMIYGYFYYPLFTFGSEQILRIGEAAITAKFVASNGPTTTKTFFDRIKWLEESGVISPEIAASWHVVREARNYSSHPSEAAILTPGMVQIQVVEIVNRVNALFSRS